MPKRETSGGCCGGRRGRPPPAKPSMVMAPNPTIRDGVALFYVGGRTAAFKVASRQYHVGPARRDVLVEVGDVDTLIGSGEFVRRA